MEHEARIKSVNLNQQLLTTLMHYDLFQLLRIVEQIDFEFDLLRGDITKFHSIRFRLMRINFS